MGGEEEGERGVAYLVLGWGGGGRGRLWEVGMGRNDGKGVLAEGEGRINIESGFRNWFYVGSGGWENRGKEGVAVTSIDEKRCDTRGFSGTQASSPHPFIAPNKDPNL